MCGVCMWVHTYVYTCTGHVWLGVHMYGVYGTCVWCTYMYCTYVRCVYMCRMYGVHTWGVSKGVVHVVCIRVSVCVVSDPDIKEVSPDKTRSG